MPSSQFKFLRPEDLKRAGIYEFDPKLLVEGYFAGRHRSHQRGISTEFRDFRPYVPGDDPKLVDWRVFGRTDRFYLRTFQQETSSDCHLFLDSSASMGFGDGMSKLDYASFLTASLCYLVVKGQDRCSLTLFDNQVRNHFPPGSTTKHLHDMVRSLEENQPGEKTSLAEALRKALPLIRNRGTLVIISDFFDEVSDIFNAFNPYLHRGFRIFLFQLVAPEELELPDDGLLRFEDMETGGRVIAHTSNVREPFQQAMENHIRNLRGLAQRRQIHYSLARTDQPFYHLFEVLAQRKR